MVITKKIRLFLHNKRENSWRHLCIHIYLCNMCIFSNGPLFLRELQSSERGIIIMITIYTNLVDRNAR